MGTRDKVKLAIALIVTAAAAMVLVIGVAQRFDKGAEHYQFSDADEDRLLTTCLTVADDVAEVGLRCPGVVRTLIDMAEERGCDYGDAASMLAALLGGIEPPDDWCTS